MYCSIGNPIRNGSYFGFESLIFEVGSFNNRFNLRYEFGNNITSNIPYNLIINTHEIMDKSISHYEYICTLQEYVANMEYTIYTYSTSSRICFPIYGLSPFKVIISNFCLLKQSFNASQTDNSNMFLYFLENQ